MKFYIDVDDVLINTGKIMEKYYNENYCYHPDFNPVDYRKIYYWNANQEMPLFDRDDLHLLFGTDYFFDNVEFMDGALKGIKSLRDMGHEVIFCSIGTYDNVRKKRHFLQYHFCEWIKDENLCLIEREDCSMGKGEYVKDGVLLDDNQDNLTGASLCDILFMPNGFKDYNSNFRGYRVISWDEFIDAVNCGLMEVKTK